MFKTLVAILLFFLLTDSIAAYKTQHADAARIAALEARIAVLERKTAPVTETFDNLCTGKEDDFYEGFYRLLMERCENGK